MKPHMVLGRGVGVWGSKGRNRTGSRRREKGMANQGVHDEVLRV